MSRVCKVYSFCTQTAKSKDLLVLATERAHTNWKYRRTAEGKESRRQRRIDSGRTYSVSQNTLQL